MKHAAGRKPSSATHRLFRAALVLGSILSLVVCGVIATQWTILGVPEAGWYYGYIGPFTVRPLGAALLVCGISSALLVAVRPTPGLREWIVVFAWILAGTGLQGLLRSMTPLTFERIFVSDAANSFYTVTRSYDASAVLAQFADVRANSPIHAQSNMPGKLLLLYALRTISLRPDVLPWLIVLVSNLGGALMYVFVRDLFSDRRLALYSLVLYLLVPAKLFFFPLMNTVTPVVVLCCALLLLRWLQTARVIHAALLGVALYALVLYEPLPLVMGLFFLGLMVHAVMRGEISRRQVLRHVPVGAAAFAAAYGAMRLRFGFDMIDAFRQISAHAAEFNAIAARPYSVWIRANLAEFAFGVGICQAVVFWAALADGLRTPGGWRIRLTQPITVVCSCVAASLLVTDLIGVNRGEVIRLWIFLACFFQIPAAYVCSRLPGHAAILLVVATTALQAALGTAMMGFVIM